MQPAKSAHLRLIRDIVINFDRKQIETHAKYVYGNLSRLLCTNEDKVFRTYIYLINSQEYM